MSIKDRGFGSMSAEKKRAIASMGGRAAHQYGTAHQWTPEEARAAGRKGGKASAAKKAAEQSDTTETPVSA